MGIKTSALLMMTLVGCGQVIAANVSEGGSNLDAAIVGMDGSPDAADVMDASFCGPYFVRATTSGAARIPSAFCSAIADPGVYLDWYQTWLGGDAYTPCRIAEGGVGSVSVGYNVGVYLSADLLSRPGPYPAPLAVYNLTATPRPGMAPQPRCYWSSDECVMEQDPASDYRALFEARLVSSCLLTHDPTRSVPSEDCAPTVRLESLQVRGRPVTRRIISGRDAGVPPDAPSCL